MKGKRLLILGAALALGLSACANSATMMRKNPFMAVGESLYSSGEPSFGSAYAAGDHTINNVSWYFSTCGNNNCIGWNKSSQNHTADATMGPLSNISETTKIGAYQNVSSQAFSNAQKITISVNNSDSVTGTWYVWYSVDSGVSWTEATSGDLSSSTNAFTYDHDSKIGDSVMFAFGFGTKKTTGTRIALSNIQVWAADSGSSSSSSSEEPSSSSSSSSSEEPINYGTAESPLTIAEAKLVLEKTGSEFSAQPLFVRGIVSTNKAFSTTYDNAEIWLQSEDTLVEKDFELYSCGIDPSIQNTASLKVADGLKGCDVVATGYGKVYYGTTTVYELTNVTIDGDRVNPSIVSLTRPALASISLNHSALTLEVGESETLVASPNPTAALLGDVTWSSSNNQVVEVNSTSGKITAIAAGSATITGTYSGKSASCEVTVTSSSTSVALPENGLTFNCATLGLDENTSYASNHNRSLSVGDFAITLDPNSSDAIMKGSTPYNSTNLGVDCMQFKKGPFEAIAITTKIQAAKKATVSLYSWGYATQAKTYLPSFKIGSSSDSILANETNGGTANAAGVDTGISYTSTGNNPQTKNFYLYTLTYDLSSLSNEKLTFVTASGGATYVESIVIDNLDESSITPTNYLSGASSYATLHGNEEGTTSASVVFADLSYENEQEITTVSVDANVSIALDKATGSNPPKYFDNGQNLRCYSGNTIAFSAASGTKIIRIEFKFTSNNTNLTSSNYANGVWNGEADSVVFNATGKAFMESIRVVYYSDTYSVDNISIRFGASISSANWNSIKNHEGWNIADYGVMMAKKTTLTGYGENNNTVEKAFRNKGASYVSIVNKTKNGAAYADPYLPDGGTAYSFTARLSFNSTTGFDTVVCARPFVKVGSEYYFIGDEDIEFSVNSLASYYIANPTYMGGASLSNKGLTYLSTAH